MLTNVTHTLHERPSSSRIMCVCGSVCLTDWNGREALGIHMHSNECISSIMPQSLCKASWPHEHVKACKKERERDRKKKIIRFNYASCSANHFSFLSSLLHLLVLLLGYGGQKDKICVAFEWLAAPGWIHKAVCVLLEEKGIHVEMRKTRRYSCSVPFHGQSSYCALSFFFRFLLSTWNAIATAAGRKR